MRTDLKRLGVLQWLLTGADDSSVLFGMKAGAPLAMSRDAGDFFLQPRIAAGDGPDWRASRIEPDGGTQV